jgi:hypothetical protein
VKITIETIRDFLNQQSKHITHYLVTHYLVAHSNYSAYHKDSKDIEKMAFNLGKDLRRARNYFNKELYGNGARRKPLLLQPLLIPTIEGIRNTANPKLTIHYNIYLGNLPNALTTADIKTLWTYCWVDKAQQKNDIYITEPLAKTQSHLIHYGTKDAQFGNTSCWDFENTQMPYSALKID